MAHEFVHERVIEFVETDMAGIVHFSNFFRYMESAEHAFFASLGLELHRAGPSGEMAGWARVHAGCDYSAPLFYQDRVRVKLFVAAKTGSTLSYDFRFERVGEREIARTVASGRLTVAYVGRESSENAIRARSMPATVARAIDVAPAGLLNEHRHNKKG